MQYLIDANDLQSKDAPAMAATLVIVVGVDAAALLINKFGGMTFPFSKNLTSDGQARFAQMAEVIGQEAAHKITRHFGGDFVYIPNCDNLRRRSRNRAIIAEFDRISPSYGANAAVSLLARRHSVSDRHVWNILKTSN